MGHHVNPYKHALLGFQQREHEVSDIRHDLQPIRKPGHRNSVILRKQMRLDSFIHRDNRRRYGVSKNVRT